ncbi:MAG: dienelactone hydrolase family protein [Anaerolineales bacterium]|nr:dienelactone hydrolase family protein [Anaerolineales bacterium]
MSGDKDFNQAAQEMMKAYSAGEYAKALEFSERAAENFPEKAERTLLWRVCLLSRVERTDESLRLLAAALEDGYWWQAAIFSDPDLDGVRELPEFQQLVEVSRQRAEANAANQVPQRFVVEPVQGTSEPYPLLLAMHGRGHNSAEELDFWGASSRLGWLVVSLQSSQALTMTGFCWDDLEKAEREVLDHLEAIRDEYPIDKNRIVLGGFSQGAGLAILSSLNEKVPACGFVVVGAWAPDVGAIAARAPHKKAVKGYFVIGENDHTREVAEQIHSVLREAGLELEEERYPELGHEFSPDYEITLDKALKFLSS